ncbi:hypothetical protein HMSSN036_33720 [Paenibacillus macerans]|nr:hypothetical protein HMSSN036_33720 [Paenibacillus macerans]
MSLTYCNVHFTQEPERVVYLSGALMKNLKLSGKKSVHLRLGGERVPAVVKPIKKRENTCTWLTGCAKASKFRSPAAFFSAVFRRARCSSGR